MGEPALPELLNANAPVRVKMLPQSKLTVSPAFSVSPASFVFGFSHGAVELVPALESLPVLEK